jgi:DHA1 family multidrug resistance protein-like MFS transporter
MLVGLFSSGILSFGFPNCPDMLLLSALWALESVGIVIADPAEAALVSDLTGSDIRGAAYGLYLSAVSLGSVIGPILGGWMYDRYQHSLPFYVNGLLMIADGIIAMLLLRNHKAPHAGTV